MDLNERENLIKEAKIKVYKEEKVDINNRLKTLNEEYSKIEDTIQKQKIKQEFDELVLKEQNLEGTYNIDIAKGQIKNIFKKTIEKEEYKETLKDQKTLDVVSTFANGFGNIIGDYLTSGASLVAGLGDATFGDKNYGLFDALGDTAFQLSDLDLLPSSEQESGRLFNDSYEFTPSFYSVGKAFSNTAPFSIALIMDLKGGDAKGVYQKVGKYISPKNIDKANDISKSINMAKRAYQLTLTDNLNEAKELGLDGGKAFVYQQAVSTITGAVSLINPDFKFFNTSAGKTILKNFSGSLKSAVNRKAIAKTTQKFITDIAKEVGEEEMEFALTEITSIGLVENYQTKFTDIQQHKDLIANTIAGTGVFAGAGLRSNYKKTKIDFYKDLTDNFDGVNNQLDELLNLATDDKIISALEESKELLGNVSEAINKSPKNVTSNQIDLLIEKKKIINEMKSMDDSFHPKFKEQIEVINEKIRKDLGVEKEPIKSTVTPQTKEFTDALGETEDLSEMDNGVANVNIDGANVSFKSEGDKIVLKSISVESIKDEDGKETNRGQEKAKKALKKVTDLADEKGIEIELTVNPLDETTTKKGLVKFYTDNDFESTSGDKMVRKPKVDDSFQGIDEVIETAKKESKPQIKTDFTDAKPTIGKNVLDNETKTKGDTSTNKDVQSGNITDNNKGKNKNIQPTTKPKTNSKKIEVETTANTYDVSVKDGELVIEPKLGEPIITPQEKKKIEQEYIKQTDFSKGKIANFEGKENATPTQISETIAEESENAVEIINEIKEVSKRQKENIEALETTKEDAISDALKSHALTENAKTEVTDLGKSYTNTGLKKNKDRKSIDEIREIAETNLGQKISKQEVLNFLNNYTKISDYTNTKKQNESDNLLKDLEDRFKQITGLKATTSNINKIAPIQEESTKEVSKNDKETISLSNGLVAEKITGKNKKGEIISGYKIYNPQDSFYKATILKNENTNEYGLGETNLDLKVLQDAGLIDSSNGFEVDVEGLFNLLIPNKEISNTEDDIPFQTESKQVRPESAFLRNLVDRLKKTGLANDVFIWSDNQIKKFLKDVKDGKIQKQEVIETPNGFVYKGDVYINRDKVKSDTPIHEFGHLWNAHAKKNHREVYNRGIELMSANEKGDNGLTLKDGVYYNDKGYIATRKDLQENGNEYVLGVLNNPAYDNLNVEQVLEEALAQAIGEKGVKILNESKKKGFANWLTTLFKKIANGLGLRNMSGDKLLNLKLAGFSKLDTFTLFASADLLANKEIVPREKQKTPKGKKEVVDRIDVIVESEIAKNEAISKLKEKIEASESVSKAVKDEIIDYIKENLPKKIYKFINPRERQKLLNTVKNAKTKTNLLKAVESIDELVGKLEQRLEDEKVKIQKEKQKRKDDKEYIKEVKSFLKQYINYNINFKRNDNKSKQDLKKLLTLVEKTESYNQLIKSLSEVDNIVLGIDNRILNKKIESILGKKFSVKSSGRIKANLVTEEVEKILNQVNKFIKPKNSVSPLVSKNKKTETLITALDKRAEILAKEEKTDNDYLEIEGLSIAIDYLSAQLSSDNKSANKLFNDVFENINNIYNEGRSDLKELRENNKIELQEKIDNYVNDADLKGERTPKSDNQLDKENKTLKSRFERTLFVIGSGKLTGSLDSIMTILSKKGGEGRDSSPLVQLVNRMKNRETYKKNRVSFFSKTVIDSQKRIFGSKRKAEIELNKKQNVKIRKNYLKDTETTPKTELEVELTNSELLNLWMNYKNPKLRKGLEKSGYDKQFFDELKLSDNLIEYANSLYGIYEDLHTDTDKTYKKIYFHSMGKEDFYAGKIYRDTQNTDTEALSVDGSNFSMNTTGYGSQKERMSNDPILAMDVNSLIHRAIAESSHFISYAEIHKEYSKLLKDKEFNQVVRLSNGKNGDLIMDMLNYYRINDLEQGGVEKGSKILDFFGRNITKGTLALKAKVGITQTVSFFNGAVDMPSGIGSKFFTYYEPIRLIKTMQFLLKESDYLKNRYDVDGVVNAVTGLSNLASKSKFSFENETLEANKKHIFRFTEEMSKIALANVKYGDMVGLSGAVPTYLAWKDKYQKQGFSEQKAHQKALKRFEASVDRSQQTTSTFGKSAFQKHPVARYFAMFATSPIQNMQNANYHWRELYRGLTKGQENAKGTNVRNILGILNYQFAQPMLYTYISQLMAGSIYSALGFGDEEQDDIDISLLNSFIFSNYGSLPVIGGIGQMILDRLSGKEYSFGGLVNSALIGFVDGFNSDLEKWLDAKTKASSEKYKKRALKKLSTLAFAFPSILSDVITDLDDIYLNDNYTATIKVLKGLGWSNYMIENSRKKRISREKSYNERKKKRDKYIKSEKDFEKSKQKLNPLFMKENQR